MIDNVLDEEWLKAARASRALSVILLDIDHFKKYNDHSGLRQGHGCLKQRALILSGGAIRKRDFFQ